MSHSVLRTEIQVKQSLLGLSPNCYDIGSNHKLLEDCLMWERKKNNSFEIYFQPKNY